MPTYKDEKTGLWYCKFVYTDWTGTKKQKKKKGFRLQKEAKQYELDFLSKTSNSCDMLFSDMVEIYMDDCKARIRPTTYKGKEDIIAVHIMPYFKNLKVNEIQPMNVRRWQTELMNNQRNYKPTYLRTLNSQLSAIFNFAVKYYGLSSNPVQKSGTIGKKNSGLEQIWTADEFKFFIDAVSDKLQSKVIFNLLYWTGMRSGEMLALTLNDFDFEERTVSITKNYARIDGEDLFLDPKTPKSNRKIYLAAIRLRYGKGLCRQIVRLRSVRQTVRSNEALSETRNGKRLQEDRTPGDTGARSSSQPRQLADRAWVCTTADQRTPRA